MSFSMIHVSPVIRAGSISWQDEYTWGAGAIFNAFFWARCPSRMVSHVVALVVRCQKHSPRRWMFQHLGIGVNLTPLIIVICACSAGSTETGRNPAVRMWGVWEHHRAAEMSVSARRVNTSILYRALFYWKVLTHFLGKMKALIFVMHVPYSCLKLEPTGGFVLLSMSAGSESKWYVKISNNLYLRVFFTLADISQRKVRLARVTLE